MATTPISFSAFGSKRFKRYDAYAFASKDTIAPLVLRELPRASLSLPIALTKVQEAFVPVAVMGLGGEQNLFVAPDGRWVGRYVPAVYRAYPFMLANGPENRQILCFDESSGLLSASEGEPFFTDDQKPTEAVNSILNFLTALSANRQATRSVCALLAEHELIEPWHIKLQGDDQATEKPAGVNLKGLYRVNEVAFNQLEEKPLHALHQGGALPLIYCQMLSMQHLPMLGELTKAYRAAQQQAALPKNDAGDMDLSFLADDTTISFENL